jgi:hypothetical protein
MLSLVSFVSEVAKPVDRYAELITYIDRRVEEILTR